MFISQPKSAVYNLHPLSLPTSIKFTYALLIVHYLRLVHRLVRTAMHHFLSTWNKKNTAERRWTWLGVRVPEHWTINR